MPGGGKFYGREKWNPRRIVTQILVMQILHYLSFGIMLLVLSLLLGSGGTAVSLRGAMSWTPLNFTSKAGWVVVLASVLSAVAGAFWLSVVVERSKKCLDFTFTQYFWHTVAVSVNQGLPSRWEWWLTQAACCVLMAVLGVHLCQRREMQEIPVDEKLLRRKGKGVNGTPAKSRDFDDEGEEKHLIGNGDAGWRGGAGAAGAMV